MRLLVYSWLRGNMSEVKQFVFKKKESKTVTLNCLLYLVYTIIRIIETPHDDMYWYKKKVFRRLKVYLKKKRRLKVRHIRKCPSLHHVHMHALNDFEEDLSSNVAIERVKCYHPDHFRSVRKCAEKNWFP